MNIQPRLGMAIGLAAFAAACNWFDNDDHEYRPVSSGGGGRPRVVPPAADQDAGVDPDQGVPPDASVPPVPAPTRLFTIGSDFTRGEGRRFDLTTNSFVGSAIFAHSDAGGWVYDGQRWVVNRLGRDSFQGFELESDIPTTPEITLEPGSNPQSIVVRDGYAYLPSYGTSEIVKYDIASGLPVDWYNLVPYTVDDGDRNARPSPSLLAGGRYMVVGNQDLPTDLVNSPTSSYTAPAKLVVLDTETGRLEAAAITLPFSNVVSMDTDPDDPDMIYASCSGTYDTADDRGGVAAVRFSKRRVVRRITDEALGGTPGVLAAGAGRVFVSVTTGFESPRVLSVGVDLMRDGILEIFASNGFWIPKLAWAGDRLAIADQDPLTPGLYFTSEDGAEQEGPFVVEGGLPFIDLFPYRP